MLAYMDLWGIDLSNNAFWGPLPDFANLIHAQNINLAGNRLTGAPLGRHMSLLP